MLSIKAEATASHPEAFNVLSGLSIKNEDILEQVANPCSYIFYGGEMKLVKICSSMNKLMPGKY